MVESSAVAHYFVLNVLFRKTFGRFGYSSVCSGNVSCLKGGRFSEVGPNF
jgi:hypothetical protein